MAAGRSARLPAVLYLRGLFASIHRLWRETGRLLVPSRCVVCDTLLSGSERGCCSRCFSQLPFTGLKGRPGNGVERLFWHRVPVERANAYLYHLPGSESRRVVHALKYHGWRDWGVTLGRCMARDLADTDFFEAIDCIVPVPLSPRRKAKRGYNQSEALAEGVGQVTGLPVNVRAVERVKDNVSQTLLSHHERRENVQGIFRLRDAEALAGRHVLLVDDVLTTGATLLACAEEMARAEGVRISILVLALAGRHPAGRDLHLS